ASIIAESHLSESAPTDPGRAPLGSLGWAIAEVRCQPEVQPLIARLLSHVLLAEDLNTALRLREKDPSYAVATLSGEFITREGIIHG
ncbi:MAG: hypothetical protein NWQ95_05790, partial [Verrucomicrobiales bacterium]|nr:hypothetical protein [Verrucomicrobiales bacterium]